MEGLKFSSFKDWALLGLLSGGVFILYAVKTSVEALNINVAVVVERTSNMAETEANHEKRIQSLEQRK